MLLFYQISRIVKSSLVKRPAEEEDGSRNRKRQSECDRALHFEPNADSVVHAKSAKVIGIVGAPTNRTQHEQVMSRLLASIWSGTLAESMIQTISNGLTNLGKAFKQSLQLVQDEVSPVRMNPPGHYLLFGQDMGIHRADAPKLFDAGSGWWNSRMIDAILQVVEERSRRPDISHIVHGNQRIRVTWLI
jgi:hypothetical protein